MVDRPSQALLRRGRTFKALLSIHPCAIHPGHAPGGHWRAFRELPPPHRRMLCRAFLWLPLCALLLRWLGFHRVWSLVNRPLRRPGTSPRARTVGPGPAALARARDAALMVAAAASRGLHKATCLHRSLVLHGLLLRDGVPSELRIGVVKGRAGLEAHAWVEVGGTVVGEVEEWHRTFVPLEKVVSREREGASAGSRGQGSPRVLMDGIG